MVWGSGGRDGLSLATSVRPSTRTEGNVRLRKTNSNIGERMIQASMGLHVLQH